MKQASPAVSLRNSAVELLRIAAMLMIVLSHICVHSGFDRTYAAASVNRLFTQFGYLGNLGVVLFLMISGYFQAGKTFRTQAFSRLLSQVWFYSLACFLIFRFGFGQSYDSVLPVFFPTVYEEYWFFTVYFLVLILAPALNRMTESLTRQQFSGLLAALVLAWVVIPTVTKQQMYAYGLPECLLYYLLGSWLRRFPDNPLKRKSLRILLSVGSFAVLYGLTVVLAYLERYSPEAFGASDRFYARNSLLITLCAVGLFSLAVYARPFHSRFLNTLGGCTFGVYLIHDNPAVREFLWKNILHWGDYFTSGSFIPRLLVSVLLVYSLCTLVEWLRQKTIARPLERGVDAVLKKLLSVITSR